MEIDTEKLKNLNAERPQYVERYDQKAFQSKYQVDLIKGIVEIIKNGVDAYINEKGIDDCSEEQIKLILGSSKTKNDVIKIVNFAKGMNSDTFKKALGVGADTSGSNQIVTGAHGYGMKEAAWAFKQTRIITVCDGKYSIRIFYWDENGYPKYAWDKDEEGEITDRELTESILNQTGIKKEGTCFEALVPEDIPCPRADTLVKQLSDHILLRTINQSSKFKITLQYQGPQKNTIILPIKYNPPEVFSLREDRKEMAADNFSFIYPGYGKITCDYKIYLSNRELPSAGDTREAGLLICAGPFSVLDCTLFDHGDRVARRFFGKVILSGPMREISKKEKIIDDKRESGLIKKTPLYTNLFRKFHNILEELINKERKRLNKKVSDVTKSILDNKVDLIKEFNKIDRQETDDSSDIKGDQKFLPGPNGIRFCVPFDYLKLVEKQSSNKYIVIDTSIIPKGTEISIDVDKTGLEVEPKSFTIDEGQIDKDGIFKKKVTFKSDEIDNFLVIASASESSNQAELNVEVIKDPRLHIEKPFEFVPDNQDIVSGKTKKFPLIIDSNQVSLNDKIEIDLDNYFTLKTPVKLKDASEIYENYYELIVSIHCSGKPKQKGKISAKIKEEKATLSLNIIHSKDRHLKGDFEGIKEDDSEDPEEISYYEKKLIHVCINHPVLRHYKRTKLSEKNIAYRVLYSDIIIKEFCKVLTMKKIKPFSNVPAEKYRVMFNEKFEEMYKKHSSRLHKICIDPKYIEKLKVSD